MVRNLLGLFMILLLNGETVSSHVLETASPPQRHVVEIREFSFHPKRTVAFPGDTVVWINRDVVPHTATVNDGTWGSPELQEGESWEMAVGNSGVQDYFCEFHPHMKGMLEVRLSRTRHFARRGRTEHSQQTKSEETAMNTLTESKARSSAPDGMTVASAKDLAQIGEKLSDLGAILIRYGLALVIFWIGAMKFTAYEANGIQPLVANSPLMGWVYGFLSVQAFSSLLGVVEIGIAVMIGLRWLSPKVSAVGSVLGMLMFLTTMSFLFSTPGWEPSLGGFPALAVVPGQFLLKDIVLFGASVWSLGESLASLQQPFQ